MIRRFLILSAATSLMGVALACGDNANCTSSHCNMGAKTAAATDAKTVDGTHVALEIGGMTCGSCADKLHASLLKLDGVKAATISHETGKADVAYDAEKVTVEAIIAVVTTDGHFTAKKTDEA
jgi:copper chaperone CopZ